ncbi:hypothetical protein EF910_37705 [Streptomyces sp. WAC07149]|uniref:hypothetical protein n=1 Tax=Streptomyces sp. WAC07149 TaxID=2487425 RepID=UPI000F781FA2|nr:hypothetical protein [Streptomyces sp. WAC07149]RSS98857.1 hypothetical protein EF910_37705 [Streptomyces sp. WAC07149]
MYVELTRGVLVNRMRAGTGMRLRCPSDVGDYLTGIGWARVVPAAHRLNDGRQLVARQIREIPGASDELSEWPSWMRPAWVRPDGRAVLSGDDRPWLPTRCRSCPRFGYALKERLPADAHREEHSDAWVIGCPQCVLR